MRLRTSAVLLALVFGATLVIARSASAQAGDPHGSESRATLNVGIEGNLIYRYAGEIRARPFNAKSPVVIRVASSAPDGAATLYDLRYIGSRPGRYDLRDALERIDGQSLGDAPEAIIEVAGLLPEDHNGELIETPGLGLPRLSPYRLGLIVLGAIWIVPLVVLIMRRVFRKRAVAEAVIMDAPLTLADQLRPLVEAAIAGRANVEELARLERLLIAHWRDRAGLSGLASHDALSRLKQHASGGEILRNVESWLHRPRSAAEAVPDVAAMLEPYRRAGRIDLDGPRAAAVDSCDKTGRAAVLGGVA